MAKQDTTDKIVLFRIVAKRRTRAIAAQCALAMVGPGLYAGPASVESEVQAKIDKDNAKATAEADRLSLETGETVEPILWRFHVIDPLSMDAFYAANKPERVAPRREKVKALIAALDERAGDLPDDVQSLLDELNL